MSKGITKAEVEAVAQKAVADLYMREATRGTRRLEAEEGQPAATFFAMSAPFHPTERVSAGMVRQAIESAIHDLEIENGGPSSVVLDRVEEDPQRRYQYSWHLRDKS